MAYPKHYLLAFGGPLGSDETWSCSLRMTSQGIQSFSDEEMEAGARTSIDEVATKVRAFHLGLGNTINQAAQLGFVKFNAIGPDGKYINTTTYEKQHQPALNPSSGSGGPFQIAAAVSFETGVQRGLAVSGRFFVPVANMPTSDGYIVTQAVDDLRNDAHRFVKALNNWDGFDLPSSPEVCVVSRGKKLDGGTWGPGIFRPVTAIVVGNVLDTQQRRRRQLPETYRRLALADETPA